MLAQLASLFGDIYLHADYQLALTLGPVAIHDVSYAPQAIAIALDRTRPDSPLRLTVADALDLYHHHQRRLVRPYPRRTTHARRRAALTGSFQPAATKGEGFFFKALYISRGA